jgi:hypothetical protein
MARLRRAWWGFEPEQRIAAVGALALFITMFFPWYGLQSLNRKTGAIYAHSINAFGDVSFVEAAIFLVAVGVLAMLLARVEGREFALPGGDGTIAMVAGGWASLLIFYRVFDRPPGNGYPVGIEWGFFLAFVASGGLAYAGWRMRGAERGTLHRHRRAHTHTSAREPAPAAESAPAPVPAREGAEEPPQRTLAADLAAAAQERARKRDASSTSERTRPRYPPAPSEQMSFEDPPTASD